MADGDSGTWTVHVSPDRPRVREALLTVADGSFGTRSLPEDGPEDGRVDAVYAAGAYGPEPPGALLAAPDWTRLGEADNRSLGWTLSLLDATVAHVTNAGSVTSRFAVASRPGTAVLRHTGPRDIDDPRLAAPRNPDFSEAGVLSGSAGEDGAWMAVHAPGCAVATAVRNHPHDDTTLDRFAGLAVGRTVDEAVALARRRLDAASVTGWEGLLAEQRATWSDRWAGASVEIDGDPRMEQAVRFAILHLLSSVAATGEAAAGARGLSGPGYRGHVFWDADVFVLPVLAALAPRAARAMLEYRFCRLPAALARAAELGLAGARFPWESAATGRDVTPHTGTDPTGRNVLIRTGEMEEHVVADVAWATNRYAEWTGDDVLAEGPGREVLLETARYWAARVDDDPAGPAHILHVIGPDEYHEDVDDNAYTNAMARWNLRTAAHLVGSVDGSAGSEARRWDDIAGRLVDGYDPDLGRHHQFTGFDALEPILITKIADPPVAADILLGYGRVHRSQVIKQADVVMAHHLLADDLPAGSLSADLDFALPRTAHGSSLSPAIHAAQLARAGRPDEALTWLDIAAGIDLEDLTGTTAGGLHLAAMGGLWQAIAFGFLGIRGRGPTFELDPILPTRWTRIRLVLGFRGCRVAVTVTPTECVVLADPELPVRLGRTETRRGESHRFRIGSHGWEVTS